ncbi:MAG TPA: hypothetical protein VGM70_00915 [Pseudolysinimonas sp.]
MIALLALSAVALWASLATVAVVARDGYGPVPTRADYESSRSA